MIHIQFPSLIAYMIPIVVGVLIMGADELSTFLGAAIIAVSNLLIHTPQVSRCMQESSFYFLSSLACSDPIVSSFSKVGRLCLVLGICIDA